MWGRGRGRLLDRSRGLCGGVRRYEEGRDGESERGRGQTSERLKDGLRRARNSDVHVLCDEVRDVTHLLK